MQHYIALIHKDPESDYGVSFPDFPGLVTGGRTLDEAQALAGEALSFHVEGMADDGLQLPPPTPLQSVMAERENREGVAILVALGGNVQGGNVSLPEDILSQIDAYAEAHGLTRSGFLTSAARRALESDAA